jgi:hypothetical protein
VNYLSANKANVSDLNALSLTVNGKASIADLNATNARINALSASAITTSNLQSAISNLGAVYVRGSFIAYNGAGVTGNLTVSGNATISGTLNANYINKGGEAVATQNWVIANFRRK